MAAVASVFELDSIAEAAKEINQIKSDSFAACNEELLQAVQLVEETQTEEKNSRDMLEYAKITEAAKYAVVIELEARIAQAYTELASASDDPDEAAAIEAEIDQLEGELADAKQEYEEAVAHREALEKRYEMAVRCVALAQDRLDTLQMYFETGKRNIERIVDRGSVRLNLAYEDLQKYLSRIAPDVRNKLDKWFNDEPEKNTPVRPNDIRDKLDVDENVIDAILEHLYATDTGFRANIDSYCSEMKAGNEYGAELKIKKQMVGRLCEEIVIMAFNPIGSQITTQARENLPDGRYTKVDMIVDGIKNPIVLGRGKGMGVREGGSLAVEVKSGHSSYIYQQLEHMQNQAAGHQGCDASCVICTRDIHDLSLEKENELREKLKEAGSPMIGMLPRKDSLDSACINFVRRKSNDI